MAATAAYVDVVRIPQTSGTQDDSYTTANGAPAVDTAFTLLGGLYGVSCKASTYGTVTLQKLLGDGSTWVAALTAIAADGYSTVNLAPGSYRIHLA